ncbi:MAG: hypothetical protein OEX97_00830 [Acidimicrobiia bacterium]|nr:hypothetical protein [Acidimicrobiia bacterium]
MDAFRRGTLAAAVVLSVVAVLALPIAMAGDLGTVPALGITALVLVAIWGTRLGANAFYASVFESGQADERTSDTDFV